MDVLFRRILAIRRPVVFRKRHLLYGWVFPQIEGDPIYINLERHGDEDPTVTYLHELLHCVYPEKSEDDIVKLTERVWAALSSRQRFILSKRLFSRKWRTE